MIPNIAIILTDAQRKIIWVNEDFSLITGYSLNEVVGKKPSLLQGKDSEEEAILRIRNALEQAIPIKDVITNYRKSGEAYPCQLVIHPVFNHQHDLINFIAFEVDGNEVESIEDVPMLHLPNKYKTSSLKGIDEIKLFERIRKLLKEEEIYLNPSLNLKTVADRLRTNTKYLSQVVNRHSGQNFQQFINTYRVAHVKKLLLDRAYERLTLYGIGLQCGFKNKSTFYKVFKELTGLTPKEFISKLD